MTFLSFRLLSLIYLLIPLSVFADNKTTLVIGYGEHNAAPYTIESGEELQDGIIKDIAKEIATEIGINTTFVKIPRKRTERNLLNDDIHLVLLSNPAWLSNKKLRWSGTLFTQKDIMVVRADNQKKYNQISDFKGMVIGTIRGYIYPTLEPYFVNKQLIRYDVSNLQINLSILDLNRIDALIDAEMLINYQLKQSKNTHNFKVLPLTISQDNLKAVLSPNTPITMKQLNQTLQKLKDQGVIAGILKKHHRADNTP
jgi:polar amino acid transport system substrate-binding protein